MILYRIRDKLTGKYNAGGTNFTKDGKFFDMRRLKLHLDIFFYNKFDSQGNHSYVVNSYAGYPNSDRYEIVVYDINEVNTKSTMSQIAEMLEEKNKK